ncbi:hypothetical protein [Chitinimonas naiadis]
MANALTADQPKGTRTADDKQQAWLSFWERRALPILQSTKAALAGLSKRVDTTRTDEIVELVLRDPLLTAHALRHINQRDRGSLSTDVVAIESIILLMGVNTFVEQFGRLPSIESLLLPKHPAHYFALLREIASARLAARLARDFGNMRYDARLDEIYVTALLGNLPRMLRYLEVGLSEQAPPVDMDQVALPLFARWHLPEVFNTLLDDSGASSQRGMLHRSALRLSEHLQQGWWQKGVADDLHLAAHALGSEEAEVWQVITNALLHFARNDWPYAQIFPPARWLAMLPGEWPRPKAAVTEPAKPSLSDILRELQRAGQSGASFNQIMGLAIRAQAEGIGFKRILFGLLMPGHNSLKTRYIVGAAEEDPLRQLQVELSTPHIVTRLMLKPQSIWLNQTNRTQFEALLPRSLKLASGGSDFLAMSLFVEDKPVGLFYADNQGAPLTEAQYGAFKQVCLMTGQSLTRQAKRLDLGS